MPKFLTRRRAFLVALVLDGVGIGLSCAQRDWLGVGIFAAAGLLALWDVWDA